VSDADLIAAPADVASADGAAQVQRIVPDVDILINNLGIYGARPALEISDAAWLRFFEVNVLAAIRLTRSYVPAMVGRQWVRIQYVASDSAVRFPLR
jgi:NAD(P)-dependent dehydrogenase (short-subunit alcohol dehydrogenase family)